MNHWAIKFGATILNMELRLNVGKNTSISGKFQKILKKTRDALRDLVPTVQLKNREKHAWKNLSFSKVAGCIQLY